MENIHILPTDKPSRLLWCFEDKRYYTSIDEFYFKNQNELQNQNIYITSYEEIKKGDFFYSIRGLIEKAIINYPKGEHFGKLILTTDQDLIEDGVQAIDDEFLEWFVKNPSCQEVEVLRCPIEGLYTIIPKEEPKQETEHLLSSETNKKRLLEDVSKQETLEEVAENYVNSFEFGIAHPRRVCKNAFINGAKWQQERSYSEEEVISFGEFIFKHTLLAHSKGVKNLFEQFKKK